MINLDFRLFLNSVEEFKKQMLPAINKERVSNELPPCESEDEINNLFLELRDKYYPRDVRKSD